MSVRSEYRRYLHRRRYARATITGRISILDRWRRHVGHGGWRHATHHDVEAWVDSLDVSAAVQRNYVSMLRGFYRWANREGLCGIDPTALVDRPRMPHRLPRPAPDDEIAVVLGQADEQVRTMVALMAGGGLRCCEVAALTWPDTRICDGTVHVHGKGSKDRLVGLPPQVLVMLARLDRTEAGSTGHVFRNRDGRPYSANRISRLVRLEFAKHGFTTVPHQLRHRAATAALAVDGNLLAVRDFLGHSSVSTTQGYLKVVDGAAAATSSAITLPSLEVAVPAAELDTHEFEHRRAIDVARHLRADVGGVVEHSHELCARSRALCAKSAELRARSDSVKALEPIPPSPTTDNTHPKQAHAG